MSVRDIRQEFEHQLKVAQAVANRDYMMLHYPTMDDKPLEGRPMAASTTIKGFPGTLRDHLAKLTARVQATVSEFEKSTSNLHSRLDDTDKMRKEIDSVAAEVQQITGMDNGGPA